MNEEFIGALKELVKEKGISEDLIFTTLEDVFYLIRIMNILLILIFTIQIVMVK